MTKEEKLLLLQDLCARLPHNVQCDVHSIRYHRTRTLRPEDCGVFQRGNCEIKPYLRPMSSMIEKEIDEFILISDTVLWLGDKRSTCILSLKQMDWLNAHYFDYRGLIPIGLALEAPKGMYKIK